MSGKVILSLELGHFCDDLVRGEVVFGLQGLRIFPRGRQLFGLQDVLVVDTQFRNLVQIIDEVVEQNLTRSSIVSIDVLNADWANRRPWLFFIMVRVFVVFNFFKCVQVKFACSLAHLGVLSAHKLLVIEIDRLDIGDCSFKRQLFLQD